MLEKLVRLLAPFVPMLSEKMYLNTVRKFVPEYPESVHLCTWPAVEEDLIDAELEKNMAIVKELTEVAMNARHSAGVKLRWPVKEIVVVTKQEDVKKAVEALSEVYCRICNSKTCLSGRSLNLQKTT